MKQNHLLSWILLGLLLGWLPGCGMIHDKGHAVYTDTNMDLASISTVAVLPFANLTSDEKAAGRVRDTLIGALLATEAFYVLPYGETARVVSRAGVRDATAPSSDEIKAIGSASGAKAVFTGVVREYGPVRSGNTGANVASVSLQLIETQTGKVVWSASTTKGGISIWDRLFGGGGESMNGVTEAAVDDLVNMLFK